jgi:hypothetical protein
MSAAVLYPAKLSDLDLAALEYTYLSHRLLVVMALMGGPTRERNRMSCCRVDSLDVDDGLEAVTGDARGFRLSYCPLRHDSLKKDASWRTMDEVVNREKEKSVGSMSFQHYRRVDSRTSFR